MIDCMYLLMGLLSIRLDMELLCGVLMNSGNCSDHVGSGKTLEQYRVHNLLSFFLKCVGCQPENALCKMGALFVGGHVEVCQTQSLCK